MARRKGVSKTRNFGARKAATETPQSSKEDNRLKDDPGGKSPHKMDESKLISEQVQTYRQDHYNNFDHSNHHLNNHNQLNRQQSPINVNHSNNKSNVSKQYNKHKSTVLDDRKRSTIVNSTIRKTDNRQIDNIRNVDDKKKNDNGDDRKSSSTDYRKITNTSNNNNNNNNNNINNYTNNNHNNKNIINSSSIPSTSASSSNDLKYLHKKFKRIASATLIADNNIPTTKNLLNDNNFVDGNCEQFKQNNVEETSKSSSILSNHKDSISSNSTKNNININREQEQFRYTSLNGNSRLPPSPHVETENGRIPLSAVTASLKQKDKTLFNNFSSTNYNRNSNNNNGNNNISNEGQTIYLNNIRINSQSANQTNNTELLSKVDDKTSIVSKTENATIISSNPSSTITNHNKINNSNILNNSSITLTATNIINSSNNNTNISAPTSTMAVNVGIQNQKVQQQHNQQRLREVDQNFTGRYVCPYCDLNCTKPSVLQKHIRAHTNERPYPCETCGFAFKTKSNYYKHCRSRSHALRMKGGEIATDDGSIGSDQDQDLSNSSSDVISRTASPMDERTLSPAVQQTQTIIQHQQHQQLQKFSNEKPYKPKFHNAALYAKEEHSQQKHQQHHQSHSIHHYYHNHHYHHQQQQEQNQHQYQQQQHHQNHNPANHQKPNQLLQQTYYSPSVVHQHTEQECLLQQYQSARGRREHPQTMVTTSSSMSISIPLTPPLVPHQFQQVLSSGFNESTVSSHRESTGSGFSCSTASVTGSGTGSFSSGCGATGTGPGNGGHQLNVEFLQEHISKIISQNEAIVENKELLLQKKYPKITGKSKNSSLVITGESSNSKLALVLSNKFQQQHQLSQQRDESGGNIVRNPSNNSTITFTGTVGPNKTNQQSTSYQQQSQETSLPSLPLNLSKINEQHEQQSRKRSLGNENFIVPQSDGGSIISGPVASSSSKTLATHPQNPERSIIKHLLLNARGLGVPNGEGEDAVYTCPLCKLEFKSAEELKLHTSSYCQGGPSSAPISPVASPSYKYFRSKSINVNLPEFNNPNSLAKLARSSLLHLSRNPLSLAKLAWSQLKTKPSNLVLNQLNINTNTTTAGGTSSAGHVTTTTSMHKLIDAPLPSPGPLLGKTPLVEAYNTSEKRSEGVIITRVHDEGRNYDSPKRLKFDHQSQNYGSISMERSMEPVNHCNDYEMLSMSNIASTKPSFTMCGGEIKLLDRKEERMKRFMSSGGCIIPISECSDNENSPKMIRTPLLSGGSFTEVNPKSANKDSSNGPPLTPKMMIPITPLTPSLPVSNMLTVGLPLASHFQFPPINSITAFNPLTLPPVSLNSGMPSSVMHGDKMIPFVPGIPGPNTSAPPSHLKLPISKAMDIISSPNRKKTPSPLVQSTTIGNAMHELRPPSHSSSVLQQLQHGQSSRHQLQKPVIRIEGDPSSTSSHNNDFVQRNVQRSSRNWIPSTSATSNVLEPKKSFNFTRMADNLSPRKSTLEKTIRSPDREIKHFNFENFMTKPEIIVTQQQPMTPLHVDVTTTSSVLSVNKEPTETEIAEAKNKAKSKFLRPTSLPLKPGTFTPKRHHGITPTANTLPLISPETPRPSKACIQLYLNGHAYTYLGLKCSTKMFYCTVNCPQPSYIANLHKLSMYSVWQTCAENNPHPLGLKPKHVMSLYDSRQKSFSFSMATIESLQTTVHSQSTVMTPFENNAGQFYHHQVKSIPLSEVNSKSDGSHKSSQGSSVLVGGYESNEDYTYIRGRGRGRYVCSECGIRCKKPSMLKKHIRTHTDVRPYTCQHCSFSFKTKGNLTKHMQSKTHYKKCLELGINPGPLPMDGDFMETDCDQYSITSGGGRTSSVPGESDSDDFSDGETESSDTDESKSRLPEHEAARCLLSLSMTPPSNSVSPHTFNSRSQFSQYQQPHNEQQSQFSENLQTHNGESQNHLQPSRRVISFTSPKPPFDYQKQEQYYSNPHIPKGRDDKFDESSMKPIDLTKPRVEQFKISDIIGDFGTECGFLRSLVSNTDKVRNNPQPPVNQNCNQVDGNVHLQAYLTEQALKYTKIKQSQMNKSYLIMSTASPSCMLSSSTVDSYVGKNISGDSSCIGGHAKTRLIDLNTEFIPFQKPDIYVKGIETILQTKSDSSNQKSVLNTKSSLENTTLSPEIIESEKITKEMSSEISTSLDNRVENDSDINGRSPQGLIQSSTPIFHSSLSQDDLSQSPKSSKSSQTATTIVIGTGGAKSVASEYLKMTSAEYMKSRTSKPEESEESSSDQEISNSDSNSTNLKPPSDFSGILARTVIVGEDGFKNNSNEVQPMFPRVPISDDGRPVCTICSKTFQKQHQMVLHMNIHYMERKFKCEPCAVSFRTQGHLQKHERSEAHKNKVMMTSTFGVPTTSNPRPFECSDCKVAFRIHGHLAKHLRSKTHVQKLECLQKLPFGTYAEIERAGISLTEIDTTDCDNSLASLKVLAQKLNEKDPTKLNSYTTPSCIETNSSGAMSHESGSEDSPDTQIDETPAHCYLPMNPVSGNAIGSSSSISSFSDGLGVKRKFDSFSSSSDDSIANLNHHNNNVSSNQHHNHHHHHQSEMGVEKRVRTTSET